LIVLALSSPNNDPAMMLNKAALNDQLGRVPMLIISEVPCRFTPNDRVVCLNFPFDIDELCGQVVKLLEERADGYLGDGVSPPAAETRYGWGGETTVDRGRQTEYWLG